MIFLHKCDAEGQYQSTVCCRVLLVAVLLLLLWFSLLPVRFKFRVKFSARVRQYDNRKDPANAGLYFLFRS